MGADVIRWMAATSDREDRRSLRDVIPFLSRAVVGFRMISAHGRVNQSANLAEGVHAFGERLQLADERLELGTQRLSHPSRLVVRDVVATLSLLGRRVHLAHWGFRRSHRDRVGVADGHDDPAGVGGPAMWTGVSVAENRSCGGDAGVLAASRRGEVRGATAVMATAASTARARTSSKSANTRRDRSRTVVILGSRPGGSWAPVTGAVLGGEPAA
jgi:hypothetical protein